jgi:hypothetical protein
LKGNLRSAKKIFPHALCPHKPKQKNKWGVKGGENSIFPPPNSHKENAKCLNKNIKTDWYVC